MGEKIKNFAKSFAKKKFKKWFKRILLAVMIPWGLIVIITLTLISFIFTPMIGTSGKDSFSEDFTDNENSILKDYLKSDVESANGAQDDYFGIAKKIGLTSGNVVGFMNLAELETSKKIEELGKRNVSQMSGGEDSNVFLTEGTIDYYCQLMAPKFEYSTQYIVTTTTTTVTDSKGNKNVSTKVDKTPIKVLSSADTIKGSATITYNSTVTSDNTTTTSNQITQPVNPQPTYSPQQISQMNLQPGQSPPVVTETITQTTSVETKVETPSVGQVTVGNTHLAKLKKLIQKEFPDEKSADDLLMAAHLVINGAGNDYDTDSQNGDWINEDPNDDISLDILDAVNGDNDGFNGTIPQFYQTDSRWASQPYGQGDIGTSGCGPTAFAMVISGLGGNLGQWDLNKDNILDPGEAAKYAQAEGYSSSSGAGTSWELFDQGSTGRFGIKSSGEISPSNYSYVYQQLQQGNPVVVSMHAGHFTKGGHFIVLTGINPDGKVAINDPNPATGIKEFPIEQIAAEANTFWVFTNPNMQGTTFELTVYGGQQDSMQGGGTTADGTNTNSYTDCSPRIIATDPSVIPTGKRVYIRFPEGIRHQQTSSGQSFDLDGWYTARDTGGAIKGRHIDLFCGWGSFAKQLITNIGTRSVQIVIPK